MTAEIAVIVSDLHCGSKVGLLPPGCKDENGATYGLNAFQDWLWNQWCDGMAWLESMLEGAAFDLVINGDVIEGVHHGTVEVIDPDASAHGAVAVAALQPVADLAERCWMVKGTEVHTRASENHIGKALGCEPTREGGYAHRSVRLEYNGITMSVAHHMGASLRTWTEASGLGIALNSERLEAARAGWKIPDVVCRAHRHTFGVYHDGYGMIVCTPAWQGKTRYVEKIKPEAVERCGFAVIDFRRCSKGDMPHARFFVRNLPAPAFANA